MAIEWDRIGQLQFDRIVEALVHRLYDATATVTPVNGRGGDGGIDVDVRHGNRLRIYQLKYYADGLTGRSRRSEIKKSFKRAMEHAPYEWVLVVPCTLTNPERDFVHALAAGHSVKVHVMNRAELDSRFAAHRDLEIYFIDKDALEDRARLFRAEQAIVMGGIADVTARVQALGQIVDEHLDRDWTMDFARQGDTVVHTLRAKHPRAHEVSPITLNLIGRGDGMSPELAAAVRRSVGFGIQEEVVLPPEAVERLTVEGPDWIAQDLTDVTVLWRPAVPARLAGAAAEVMFLDADGEVTASYEGRLNSVGAGGLGRSVDVNVHGSTLRLLLPHDAAAEAQLTFSFTLGEVDAATALKLLALHRRVLVGGRFQARVGGRVAGTGQLPDTSSPEDLQQIESLRLYVEDLDIVQRHCERYFPVPADLRAPERVALRMARLLVEGRCVITPFTRRITLTLNGTGAQEVTQLLHGPPQTFSGGYPRLPITVGRHTLDLGPIRFFHTRAAPVDYDQTLAAIDSGAFAGAKVTLQPSGSEHYRLFLADSPDDGQPLVPTPFGLPGYPEPR